MKGEADEPVARWTTGPPSGRPSMAAPGFARSRIARHQTARQTERIGGRSRVVVRNPGLGWRRIIEKSAFADFAALRRSFRAVDKVGDKLVFNIGGNKWRLIAHVNFEHQIVYVKGSVDARRL